MRYLRFVLLGLVALGALVMVTLSLWSGGGEQTARANPELTVGIDLNPSTPSQYDSCFPISGPGVPFQVDVFVLDVEDLMAFSADVEYNSSVIQITGVDTDLFLGSPPGSNVQDTSGPLFPPPPGKYQAGAFDQAQTGADGSGVLARFTVQGVANGLSNFDLDLDPAWYRGVLLQDTASPPNNLGDTNGDTFFDGPFINEETTISVGGAGDTDGDGVPEECDNCPGNPNDQTDTDGDGIGDKCDDDDDNDGEWDFQDNCPLIPNPGQENNIHPATTAGNACEDWDSDDFMDDVDNCPSDYNPLQEDMDVDGVGDVCDPDKDGDDVPDGADNCPDVYNPDQADTDGNGTGDACQDSDGDTVYDPVDNCPDVPNLNQDDGDGDGVGNPCDNCQSDYNPGQENTDGDALGDACDWDDDNDSVCDPGETSPYCTGSDNCQLIANGPSQGAIPGVGNQTDTDGDGPGDPCDDDADADGYSKALETGYGSKDWVYASRAEVCDGADNDGDGSVDEGWGEPPTAFPDSDGDTTPDCEDGDWDTDEDGTADKFDDDDDDDRSLDTEEHSLVTDSLRDCDDGIGYPDWAVDFNDDKQVNILDIVKLTPPVFNSEGDPNSDGYFTDADPYYSRRKDLNGDKTINILDIVKMTPPVFNTTCDP